MTKKTHEYLENHEEAFKWLKEYQTGDRNTAWKNLEAYVNKVIQVATSRINLKGYEPEDIHNDILVCLLRAMETADIEPERGTLFTFLYVAALRRAHSLVKVERNNKRKILNDAKSLDVPILGKNGRPGFLSDTIPEKVQNKPLDTKYLDVLKAMRLSVVERKSIDLWLQNQSYEEIAKNTGFAEKRVDNAIVRVKKKLLKYCEKNKVNTSADDVDVQF